MHFGMPEKTITDFVSLYNNADLNSKVSEEIANENIKNCGCRQPHCRLTPRPQGTPANIRIKLTSPETTFLPRKVWTYRHSNFCDVLRKTYLLCNYYYYEVRTHSTPTDRETDEQTDRQTENEYKIT